MDPLKKRKRGRPEDEIVAALRKFLHDREWLTIKTHGNEFQSGLPDLYCCHRKYGTRWIEVKNPLSYAFTAAQMKTFPEFIAKGVAVYVLTAATETEYKKLFGPSNFYQFLAVFKV